MDSASSIARREEAAQPVGTKQLTCWQCGAEHSPSPLCPACGAIAALPPDAGHYEVFGISPALVIDGGALARRYYELSGLLHPDRHQTGPAEAREASVVNTAALTRAYRVLRDPVARGLYWLQLHGEDLGANNNKVPPALAALVFEVQERLEEYRHAPDGEREALGAAVRAELARLGEQQATVLAQLEANFRRWDTKQAPADVLLRELKDLLSVRGYLGTLIRDVQRALGGDEV